MFENDTNCVSKLLNTVPEIRKKTDHYIFVSLDTHYMLIALLALRV